MTNKEIAGFFNDLAKMMELYEENPFRIKSYQNAYIQLRKLGEPLSEMTLANMEALKGIGKATSGKIMEILTDGKLQALEEYKAKTPEGVQEMLRLKGFGPKKIKQLWKELGVESIGELWYACNENRLVELKGFGAKTQEDLKKQVEYFQQSKGQYHFATVLPKAEALLELIRKELETDAISLVGEMGRYSTIVSQIDVLVATEKSLEDLFNEKGLILQGQSDHVYQATYQDIKTYIYICTPAEFGSKQFRYTSSKSFIDAFLAEAQAKDFHDLADEQAVFEKAGIPYILPEWRDNPEAIVLAKEGRLPDQLIQEKAIKGVIHCHTTYSDGINSLEEMASFAQKEGYEYIGITDHSKSAFYANGLKPERVLAQFAEIEELNKKMAPFRLFKGIESDILADGSLDYEESILKQFDFIIASVHSNLKMDETKATTRLIKAIENKYTTILGHPTGRLLLSRPGYPIDHKKVIDACAANGVAIELNANPYRLDIDHTWIPYAMNKGVLISINPDAHSMIGIHDIRFGVLAARKGRLNIDHCLNTKSASEFTTFLKGK